MIEHLVRSGRRYLRHQALQVLGHLVLVETAGRLRAVDLQSGQTRWTLALPAGLRPGFIADDKRIAAVTGPGELLIIDEAEGTAHRITTDLGLTRVAALVQDGVIVREGAGRFQSLNLKSGRSLWRGAVSFSDLPAVAAGAVVVGTRGRDIRASKQADGDAAWQARAAHEIVALATSFTGDQVFALDRGGDLIALSASTGSPRWTLPLAELQGQGASVSLRDDAGGLVLLGADRLLWVSHDGKLLGRLALPRESAQGGDLLDDEACWSTRTGALTCTSLSQGQDWTLELGPLALPPVLLGDRVLAATGDGRLLAIDATVAGISDEGEAVESLMLDPALPLLLAPQADAFGLSGRPATAPLLLVERAAQDRQGACVQQQAVLDLSRLKRGPALDSTPETEGPLLDLAAACGSRT